MKKLRAWHKEEKRMFTVAAWSHPGYLNSVTEVRGQSSDAVYDHCLDDVILMDSIGRKDVKDKEIFDGDLVLEIGYKWNEKTKKHDLPIKVGDGEISWGKIKCHVHGMGGGKDGYYEGWVLKKNWGDFPTLLSNYPIGDVEIIGNVHEKGDLK